MLSGIFLSLTWRKWMLLTNPVLWVWAKSHDNTHNTTRPTGHTWHAVSDGNAYMLRFLWRLLWHPKPRSSMGSPQQQLNPTTVRMYQQPTLSSTTSHLPLPLSPMPPSLTPSFYFLYPYTNWAEQCIGNAPPWDFPHHLHKVAVTAAPVSLAHFIPLSY